MNWGDTYDADLEAKIEQAINATGMTREQITDWLGITGSRPETVEGIEKEGKLTVSPDEKVADKYSQDLARELAESDRFKRVGAYIWGIKELSKIIIELIKYTNDLTPSLYKIAQMWFGTNKSEWFSQMADDGDTPFEQLNLNYAYHIKPYPLGSSYKKGNKKRLYEPYPILVRTGILRDSLTKMSPSYLSIVNIRKKTMDLGTAVDYANALALGKTSFTNRWTKEPIPGKHRNPVQWSSSQVSKAVDIVSKDIGDILLEKKR